MILIDSHCHFDDARFDDDREAAFRRALSAGVESQIVPGIRSAWWPRVKRVCSQYPGLWPAYGLHPMFMDMHKDSDISLLENWLQTENSVAVGECGLDYFIDDPDSKAQCRLFEAQLDLAQRYALPVIIHARRALEDILNILRRYPHVRGVVHSFSGSEQQAHRLIGMGFLMSFGGPITYPGARRLRHLAAVLPLESIMIESDSPDQPDVDIRGQRNEPVRLQRILAELGALRKESVQDIAAVTRDNAIRLFGLEEGFSPGSGAPAQG